MNCYEKLYYTLSKWIQPLYYHNHPKPNNTTDIYVYIKFNVWPIAALHSHEIDKREIENRCPCAECYPYHSSSSSVHSGNTTKSSDLFGDTSHTPPTITFSSPSQHNPRSELGVHSSNSRQSNNPLFGQNGNLSSNVNAKSGWSSPKPFSEHSNLGRERNSSNQLIEQNRSRSLSHYNAKGVLGRCECTCTCGIAGSPEEYTDQSSSSQFESLTGLCPSSTRSDSTRKLIGLSIHIFFCQSVVCTSLLHLQLLI